MSTSSVKVDSKRAPSHPCKADEADQPIKVLVVIPSLDIGGAEMDLVRNLPRLERTKFTPVVFPLFWQGPLSAQLEQSGIEIASVDQMTLRNANWRQLLAQQIERSLRKASELLPSSRLTRRLVASHEYMRLARSIARYADKTRSEVIHAVLPASYFVAVIANLLTRRRSLLMSRVSLNWYQKITPLFGWIERSYLHRNVDMVVGNSRAILSELRIEGLPERKLRLIYNGIDAVTFCEAMPNRHAARMSLHIDHDAIVFSSVGNLLPYKGHADLLKALSLIKCQLPAGWILLVAGKDFGEGVLEQLRALATDLDLSPNVKFLGQRQDIPTILAAADIHVSASHHEGFPNNILEAMCAGLPVVATAVGGVPEQIIDGKTGLLVGAREPVALSKALLMLVCNSALRTSMGMRGAQRVRIEFPITRSVAAWEEVYAAAAKRSFDSLPREPSGTHGQTTNIGPVSYAE